MLTHTIDCSRQLSTTAAAATTTTTASEKVIRPRRALFYGRLIFLYMSLDLMHILCFQCQVATRKKFINLLA